MPWSRIRHSEASIAPLICTKVKAMSRKKVSFTAHKKVSRPTKVTFYTKDGDRVSFKAKVQVKKPVRIQFYVEKEKKS